MECEKKKMEHKSVSVSKKKKKAMKEVVDNKRHGVGGEATTTVVVDEEDKRRYNYNYYYYNSNYYIQQGNSSSIMGIVDHDHDHNNNCDQNQIHEKFEDCRVWWRPGVLVDEQMSWGSIWYSYLDEDANCHALYSDVVEDHLWDFNTIQHTPHPQ